MSCLVMTFNFFQNIIDKIIADTVNLIARIMLGLKVSDANLTTVKEEPQRIATINNIILPKKPLFIFFFSITY